MVNFSRFRVDELRSFLINEGFDEDEVKEAKKLDLVKTIQDNDLGDKLNQEYPEEQDEYLMFDQVELDDDIIASPAYPPEPGIPTKGSPEWNDYVLSLFTSDEKVEIKCDDRTITTAKCDGLRRVAQLVLGQIIESRAIESGVHYPDYSITSSKDLPKLRNPPYAWVSYVVTFEKMGIRSSWGGCADVNANNTDPKFLPFAFTTAETRAEGRALRKALGIKVLATEEFTSNDTAATVSAITTADWSKGPITDQQKNCIIRLSSRLKIDPFKMINCHEKDNKVYFVEGKVRNESLDELTNEQAIKVINKLNELQQNKLEKDPSLLTD